MKTVRSVIVESKREGDRINRQIFKKLKWPFLGILSIPGLTHKNIKLALSCFMIHDLWRIMRHCRLISHKKQATLVWLWGVYNGGEGLYM